MMYNKSEINPQKGKFMKKYSFKDKLRYKFDKEMSKGTIAMVRMLFLITFLVVLIVGIITAFFTDEGDNNILDNVWLSLMHAIDAGTLTADSGSFIFMLLMTIVTICGLFITSVLIGIINAGLETKMEALKKGKSKVLEENHIVILGFQPNVFTIISQLIEANANHKGEVIVIMDDKLEAEEMLEEIHQKIADTQTTEIICRNGNIADLNDISMCSVESCRSVIIDAENDFETVKTILAVTNILKDNNNETAYITAVIYEKENLAAAEIASEGKAEIIYFDEIVSRIFAHTARNAGLSNVFIELFDYDGDEIYIEHHPQTAGLKFKDINRYFPQSIVMGITHNDTPILNPDVNTVIGENDELILLAEDDGVSKPMDKAAFIDESVINQVYDEPEKKNVKMLVFGYSKRLKQIIEVEKQYIGEGSEIILACEEAYHKEIDEIICGNTGKIKITSFTGNIYNQKNIEYLLTEEPDSVLVLSNDANGSEDEDSKTLLLLLHIRNIAKNKNYSFSITSEMQKNENEELASITEVNDFVVSSKITSIILTQISQDRKLRVIFEELLTEEGSELYIRPAKRYVKLGAEMNTYTASASAVLKNEVLLGYRIEQDGKFEIITNPPKDKLFTFTENDYFIVISEE